MNDTNSIFIATNFKKYHYLNNTLNFWSSWFDSKEGGPHNFWGNLLAGVPYKRNIIQLFGQLLSDIWFIWQGRADIGRSVSRAQYLLSLAKKIRYWTSSWPNNCFIIPAQNLSYVSLTIMRNNYFKNYKLVHLAQLKKSSFNSQTFQWRSISRWFD